MGRVLGARMGRINESGVEWMSWGWKAEKVWRGGERGTAHGV